MSETPPMQILPRPTPPRKKYKTRCDKGVKRGPYLKQGARRVIRRTARQVIAALRIEVRRLKRLLGERADDVPAPSLVSVPHGCIAIPLTRGFFAFVDAADRALVDATKWYAWTRKERPGHAYAARNLNGRMEWMHRVLLNAGPGDSVDHADGDGLNNRRSNLRFASAADNVRNQLHKAKSVTGFMGVTLHRASGLFRCLGRTGYFHNAVAAAIAYDEATLALNDPFRPINGVLPEHRAQATRCLLSESEAEKARQRYAPEPTTRPCGCGLFGRHLLTCKLSIVHKTKEGSDAAA